MATEKPNNLEKLEHPLEAYGVAKDLQRTIGVLEERAKKTFGHEQIDVKMALQRLTLLRKRLIDLGKKIAQRNLSEEEKDNLALEIRHTVTSLKTDLYRFDSRKRTISSFGREVATGLSYSNDVVTAAIDDYIEVEKGILNSRGTGRSPELWENRKKELLKPLDQVKETRTSLSEIYWQDSSAVDYRSYLDVFNKSLTVCADYYLACLLPEDVLSEKPFKRLSNLRSKTEEIYKKDFVFISDSAIASDRVSIAKGFIDKRIKEVNNFLAISQDVASMNSSFDDGLRVIDHIFASKDVSSNIGLVGQIVTNAESALGRIDQTGFLNRTYGRIEFLLPSQSFGLLEYDAKNFKTRVNVVKSLYDQIKEDRFSRFLGVVKGLDLDNVDQRDIPTEKLMSACREIQRLYPDCKTASPDVDAFLPEYDSVPKRVYGVLASMREELVARETIKMDYSKLQELAKKYPKYLKIERDEYSVKLVFSDKFLGILNKDPKKMTDNEQMAIADIQKVKSEFDTEVQLVMVKVLEQVELNETVKLAYRAYKALKEEKDILKAKRLYTEFLEKAKGDNSIDVALIAEAKSILRSLALFQVGEIVSRIELILNSLSANVYKSGSIFGLDSKGAQNMEAYLISQKKALTIVSAILTSDNDILTIDGALNELRGIYQKEGTVDGIVSALSKLGIDNAEDFRHLESGSASVTPSVYLNGNISLPSSVSGLSNVIDDYLRNESNLDLRSGRKDVWFKEIEKFGKAKLYDVEAQYYRIYFSDLIQRYETGEYEFEAFSKNILKSGGLMNEEYEDMTRDLIEKKKKELGRHPTVEEIEAIEQGVLYHLYEKAVFVRITEEAKKNPDDPEFKKWLVFQDRHLDNITRAWYDVISMTQQEQDQFWSGVIASLPFIVAGGILGNVASKTIMQTLLTRAFGEAAARQIGTMTLKQIILGFGMKNVLKILASKAVGFTAESFIFGESMLIGQSFNSGDIRSLLDPATHLDAFVSSLTTLSVMRGVGAGMKALKVPQNVFTSTLLYNPVDSLVLTGLQYVEDSENFNFASSVRSNYVTCLGIRGAHGIAGRVHSAYSGQTSMRNFRISEMRRGLEPVKGQEPLTGRELRELDALAMSGRDPLEAPGKAVTYGMTPDTARKYLRYAKSNRISLAGLEELSPKDKGYLLARVEKLKARAKGEGKPLTRAELIGLFRDGASGRLALRLLMPSVDSLPFKAADLKEILKTDPALFELILPKLATNPKVLMKFATDIFNGIDVRALKEAAKGIKTDADAAMSKIGEIILRAIPNARRLTMVAIITILSSGCKPEKGSPVGSVFNGILNLFLPDYIIPSTIASVGVITFLISSVYSVARFRRNMRSGRFNVSPFETFRADLNLLIGRYPRGIPVRTDILVEIGARQTNTGTQIANLDAGITAIDHIAEVYTIIDGSRARAISAADNTAIRGHLRDLGIDARTIGLLCGGTTRANVRQNINAHLRGMMATMANGFDYGGSPITLRSHLNSQRTALRNSLASLDALFRLPIDGATRLPEVISTEVNLLVNLDATILNMIATLDTRIREYRAFRPQRDTIQSNNSSILAQGERLIAQLRTAQAALTAFQTSITNLSSVNGLLRIADRVNSTLPPNTPVADRADLISREIGPALTRELNPNRTQLEDALGDIRRTLNTETVQGLDDPRGLLGDVHETSFWIAVGALSASLLTYFMFLKENTDVAEAGKKAKAEAQRSDAEEAAALKGAQAEEDLKKIGESVGGTRGVLSDENKKAIQAKAIEASRAKERKEEAPVVVTPLDGNKSGGAAGGAGNSAPANEGVPPGKEPTSPKKPVFRPKRL